MILCGFVRADIERILCQLSGKVNPAESFRDPARGRKVNQNVYFGVQDKPPLAHDCLENRLRLRAAYDRTHILFRPEQIVGARCAAAAIDLERCSEPKHMI